VRWRGNGAPAHDETGSDGCNVPAVPGEDDDRGVVAYAHAKLTEVTARRAFEARTRDAPREAVLTTASFALAMAELEESDARDLLLAWATVVGDRRELEVATPQGVRRSIKAAREAVLVGVALVDAVQVDAGVRCAPRASGRVVCIGFSRPAGARTGSGTVLDVGGRVNWRRRGGLRRRLGGSASARARKNDGGEEGLH
jgi:hypothetical protein